LLYQLNAGVALAITPTVTGGKNANAPGAQPHPGRGAFQEGENTADFRWLIRKPGIS
jgi:hypothetical protein